MNSVLEKVDQFIKLRRNEAMCLHDIMQGLKVGSVASSAAYNSLLIFMQVTDFQWLGDTIKTKARPRLSLSDTQKRLSLLSEFIYFMFDSLVIPILQSHFYVTESSTHRNRVFYFRHDIWRALTEPKLMVVKATQYEELKNERAKRILASRTLGFSTVRLLPKAKGVRIITNLKRKPLVIDAKSRRNGGDQSINKQLTPVFHALKYEKGVSPELVGSAMSSNNDIYTKLKTFKEMLMKNGLLGKRKLYFSKVDITSCFDTLPQKAVLQVIKPLLKQDDYKLRKFCEVYDQQRKFGNNEPGKSWKEIGRPKDEFFEHEETLQEWLANGTAERRHGVFVDKVIESHHNTSNLRSILEEHVQENLVKVFFLSTYPNFIIDANTR